MLGIARMNGISRSGGATIEGYYNITTVTGAGSAWEYDVYRFTSSGNVIISGGSIDIYYCLVAGGASGGGYRGGGGGAGGMLTGTATLSPGTYPVIVGAGAAAGNDPAYGNHSTWNGLQATRGGRAGQDSEGGFTGGSGGGASDGSGGSGTSGQGLAGGSGNGAASHYGGGGGKATAGGNATASAAGAGGNGAYFSPDGDDLSPIGYYAAGGGGGS